MSTEIRPEIVAELVKLCRDAAVFLRFAGRAEINALQQRAEALAEHLPEADDAPRS